MKTKINSQKTLEAPCMCQVHLQNEILRKDAIPCLGHGEGCPCFKKAKEAKIVEDYNKHIAEKQNEQTNTNPTT